ncbi:MAG: ABC transporter permease subunit [Defluviitaleaceae bacterium]|nr:ABC transporter permease subunit [Defluviitaleaceae bacterium]
MRLFAARHKKTLTITLMMLPGAIWLLLLRYLPMAGVVIAFQNYRPHPPNPTMINNILNSRFVGLENFRFIFATDIAWRFIRNTLAYNAVFIVLTTVFAIALAIALSEITKKFIAKLYQTLMFFPFFISWVVVSYFVFAFLSPTHGTFANVSNWYMDPWGWPVILTSAHLWKSLGFTCIIYLAAITGVDHGQYEAAAIDGASKWNQIWSITIPNIRPMIIIMFILAVGRIFNADIGLFYNVPLNSGPLFPVTDVVDTYVLRAFQTLSMGMATAVGLFQQIIGFICIMTANAIVRKVDSDSAIF